MKPMTVEDKVTVVLSMIMLVALVVALVAKATA